MSDLTYAYIMRIFWALFLAVMVAAAFRVSWKLENGKKTMENSRTDTTVWIDPVIFVVLLIMHLSLVLISYVRCKGFTYALSALIDIFLFVSIYFTLLLLLLPVLRKHYTARTCATLWLIPVFLFYQPYMVANITIELPYAVFYIPGNIMELLFGIWLAGFLIILAVQVASHLSFSRELKSDSRPVEDPAVTHLWERGMKKIRLNLPVKLRFSNRVSTPLTVGMRKKHKITYLPEKEYTEEELKLIFSHELHHIQRNDTHTKFFLKFCNALGWPHPFVWLAVKRAEEDLELSCDEIVLKDADSERRRTYANLLLTTAGNSRGFTTCLSASAKTLKYRMKETVKGKQKRLGIGLLFLVMFLSCFTLGKIAFATDRMGMAEAMRLEEIEISCASLNERTEKTEDEEKPSEPTPAEIKDVNSLSDYLSGRQVEKMVYNYQPGAPIQEQEDLILYGEIESTDVTFSIFGEYMEIYPYGYTDHVLYHITEPLDWEYIRTLV